MRIPLLVVLCLLLLCSAGMTFGTGNQPTHTPTLDHLQTEKESSRSHQTLSKDDERTVLFLATAIVRRSRSAKDFDLQDDELFRKERKNQKFHQRVNELFQGQTSLPAAVQARLIDACRQQGVLLFALSDEETVQFAGNLHQVRGPASYFSQRDGDTVKLLISVTTGSPYLHFSQAVKSEAAFFG